MFPLRRRLWLLHLLVALLLVLPTAVYLRGCCAIYRSLGDADPDNAASWTSSSR